MGVENHLDITAMTKAAEAPELNCKLVEEAFGHLAEKPIDKQLEVLREIQNQNARPLKPGEQRARLQAVEVPDEVSGGHTVTLIRSDLNSYNEQSIFTGQFVGHKLTKLTICGQPQSLPNPKNAPHHGK